MKKNKNISDIKMLNYCVKKDTIYFFVDDSGTILENDKYKKICEKITKNKENITNDLRAFCVTAVALSPEQVKKGQRLSKSIKSQYKIDPKAPFHRNEMKFDHQQGHFKNVTNSEIWTINRALNNYIKNNNVVYASVGINNFCEIYNENVYDFTKIRKHIFEKLTDVIQEISTVKWVGKSVIIVLESENKRSDYHRFTIINNYINSNPSITIVRKIYFMRKTNCNNVPNFGIELVDYINGSSFSFFCLQDFHIHAINVFKTDYLYNASGIKYIKLY